MNRNIDFSWVTLLADSAAIVKTEIFMLSEQNSVVAVKFFSLH